MTRRAPRASAAALVFVAAGVVAAPRGARADEPQGDRAEIRGDRGARPGGGFSSSARVGDGPRETPDAAALLEPMPGVHVRRLGADDAFSTLSIRGSGSTQVSVLYAGIPLTGGADPTLDLATLPTTPGTTLRVHRTFAPATLGRGSLGGVLTLDPPRGTRRARTEAWTGVGSFGALRLRLGDTRTLPHGARVATALVASRADDRFDYLDPIATASTGRDVLVPRDNARHASVGGVVSVVLPVHAFGVRGALATTTLLQARRQELPGPVRSPTPALELSSLRVAKAIELTLPAAGGTVTTRLWSRRESFGLRDDPASARRALSPSRTGDGLAAIGTSVGLSGRGERARGGARLELAGERFLPGTWEGSVAPPAASRAQGAAAADGELSLMPTVRASASGRLDAWTDRELGASTAGAGAAGDRDDVFPTGHLGLAWDLGPVTLRAHGGAVARPPSFVERYGNRGGFLGEPSLRPEKAFAADVGARASARTARAKVDAELAGFVTSADDLIVFVPQGAFGRAKATNVGEARIAGLEAELRAEAYGLFTRASYTFMDARNLDACSSVEPSCTRPALPGRPRHDAVLDVGYRTHGVTVRWGVDVVAGMRADLTGSLPVPDRALHGASVSWVVPRTETLTLGLDVRNLFDLRVVEYAGALGPVRAPVGDAFEYPLPGRRFLATARWVLGDAGAPPR